MITQQKLKSSVIKAQRYRCFCGPWTPGRPGHSAGTMEEKVKALGTVISLLPLWTIGSYKCPLLGRRTGRPAHPTWDCLGKNTLRFVSLHVFISLLQGEESLVLQEAGAAVPNAAPHRTCPPWLSPTVSASRPSEKC